MLRSGARPGVGGMSEGVLHHGRGLSRSSPLLAQVRSIWLPRDYVAPLCAVAGMAAASTVADPPPLWGGGVAWGVCYALLRCARSAEDVALGFDEDVSVSTSPGGVAVVPHAQSVCGRSGRTGQQRRCSWGWRARRPPQQWAGWSWRWAGAASEQRGERKRAGRAPRRHVHRLPGADTARAQHYKPPCQLDQQAEEEPNAEEG